MKTDFAAFLPQQDEDGDRVQSALIGRPSRRRVVHCIIDIALFLGVIGVLLFPAFR